MVEKRKKYIFYIDHVYFILLSLLTYLTSKTARGKIADIPENYKTNEEIIPNCNNIYNNNFYNNKK